MSDVVRLCVQSHHPIHPGNYAGPIHCTAHEDERHAACEAMKPTKVPARPCNIERYGIRGTNRHDYWCCTRCGRRWQQNPGKPPPCRQP